MNNDTDVQHVIDNTLVLVLAGGQGSRLKALTKTRAKPVLEFGGQCRIIDFPLSNCVNSGLNKIAVLTQYKSQCLIRHLMQHWGPLNSSFGGRLDILPASQQQSENWYKGTADACFQNIEYIKSRSPKYVLILAGDHVYNMDYRELLRTHVENQAEMTVSCIEVSAPSAANRLGVVTTQVSGQITAFSEKPQSPSVLIDAPDYCLASMGNYIVNADTLYRLLNDDASRGASEHDFGKNIIPAILQNHRVFAHRFRSSDGEQIPYWRDVGTLDSYWRANMDLLYNSDMLNLSDPDWPIWGQEICPFPTEISSGFNLFPCELQQVLIGTGCRLTSCLVHKSILSNQCNVEPGAQIQTSVLLPNVHVGKGAKLSNAIVDRNVHVPPNLIVNNPHIAARQGFTVSEKGIVLITQDAITAMREVTKPSESQKGYSRLHAQEPLLPTCPPIQERPPLS